MGIFKEVLKKYKETFINRYDADGIVPYLSVNNFEGMTSKPMSFFSFNNDKLSGFYYSYPNYDKNKLIIFCHGIGVGHIAYFREIEYLCKKGYEVLAFDNTGCQYSTGDNIRGLTQSLPDLLACLKYLESINENREIHLIGHSWGGYAVGNILNYYTKNIKSVCVISGFTGIKRLTYIPKAINPIYRFEKRINKDYVLSDSYDAFKNTDKNILIIHSIDDNMVNYNRSAKFLKENINNANVDFLILNGKKHNPNYTLDALSYLNETFKVYNKLKAENEIDKSISYMKSRDVMLMTVQDDDIWSKIIANINK